MPTSIWTGSLSFGLVVVPVRLYPAVRRKNVRFHELDSRGRRVRHVRVSDPGEEPSYRATSEWRREPKLQPEPSRGAGIHSIPGVVSPNTSEGDGSEASHVSIEEIRKGFEVAPGQYVSLSREEVQFLGPERSRAIDVEQFVDVSAVDPIYFESRYYVAPDRDSVAAFQVLRRAMAGAERMAIAWITLRQRRHLSAIRSFGDLMLLTTMVHSDEVLPADFWLPETDKAPTEKELKMARLLIDTLTGPFEPERYSDEHRQRLLNAIEAKAPVPAGVPMAPATNVLDLMAALEASVKAAKAERAVQDKQSKGSRRRSAADSR